MSSSARVPFKHRLLLGMAAAVAALFAAVPARASEAELVMPDLGSVQFLGQSGRGLLMGGLLVCVLGLVFGLVVYMQLKNLPVHRSMRDIS